MTLFPDRHNLTNNMGDQHRPLMSSSMIRGEGNDPDLKRIH